MAGYTRQSTGSIINGSPITAPPLNSEFNQVAAAFHGTTGHGHTGGTGDAPKIPLATSVSGYLPAVNGGVGGLNKMDATAAPIATNDISQGYVVGSMWQNTATGRTYICIVNSANAAVWQELVKVSGGNAIIPAANDTIDLGNTSTRFQDLFLSGGIAAATNVAVGGTLNVTGITTVGTINGTTATVSGLTTLNQVDANSGTIDGTVIGGNTASPITGTTITSTGGFTGDLVGDVAGNVTSTGTSGFNNITASGTIQGAVTGDVSGNVTATTGTSQFNNVTVNGTLNMDGATSATIENLSAPVNANDAARKVDVDNAVSNLVASSPAALDTLNELAAAINDDANFSTTITNSIATKLPKAGGTMTGDLTMSGATVTGLPIPTANTEASSKQYSDQQDALQVSRSGDTMSGSLGMGGNKITNIGTPTASTDVSSKGYVDGILGSATAASSSAAAAATSEANAAVSEANALTHANTAATSITTAQQFLDTYYVSSTAPTGASVTQGDLWFDTSAQILKVRSSSGFQNAGSSVNGTAERRDYTASANQTSFAAVYDPTYVDVYLNGVKLAPLDFTATDGANVVLASAAASGDTVSIVSFGTFQLADHYNKSTVDALIDDVETLALAGI